MADWIAERGWVRPELGGACFASIPGTVTEMLTGSAIGATLPTAVLDGLDARYERVVLVYFDAFGLELARRHAAHPLLARAQRDGVFARITSQFPSTTTAHMPTIHTGVPVGEHGLYEWFVLEPALDRLIAPLPYTFAGDGQGPLPESLSPDRIFPPQTIYSWLERHGAQSAVAGWMGYAMSRTNEALLGGATRQVGFFEVGDGLAALAAAFKDLAAPAYGFAYIDTLDTLLHKVGLQQNLVDAEIDVILDAIDERLVRALPAGTLVLISSDHGMTAVSPRETIYLNEGAHAAEIVSHLRAGAEPDGHPLAPAGSCRDVFLHALPGHVDDLVDALSRALGPRAEVRRAGELIDAGLFGGDPSAALRARLGDVAILPQLGDAVYWHTPGRFRQTLWGQHGGLTAQEMEIPLIAVHAG